MAQITAMLDLTSGEQQELAQVVGCAEEELLTHLAPFATAALTEYAMMFLGKRVFRRGSDHSEYRLFLLITGPMGGLIPEEQVVSRLFQTTATESRALIRSVMSKYQNLLRPAIKASLQSALSAALQEEEDGEYTVVIKSQSVVDELNRLLADLDGNLPPVSKKRGCVSTYRIAASSHARLSDALQTSP